MIRYMQTAAAAAIAVAMGASAGMAQEATTFNMHIDEGAPGAAYEDFNRGFTEWGLFDRWDTDRDEYLTQDEVATGVYGAYDADRDERLTRNEVVGMGEDRLFVTEPDAWFTWGDQQQIGQPDFTTGFRNWESYGTWDADRDAMLSREEFNRGVFDTYDVDRDAMLSPTEVQAMQQDRIFTY